MKRLLCLAILLAASPLAPAAAEEAGQGADAEGIAFFEKRVRPLLHQHCGECHAGDSGQDNGELLLDTPGGILHGGSRGAAIVPGEPEESLLVRAVRYADDELQMPPEGKLPASAIETLAEWVRRGAPMPSAAAPPPKGRASLDLEAARQFWSFQPLRRSAPPAVSRPDWPANRIDPFILARLDQEGLSPSGEADRRTLIRRLTFDLTGLPPTPDEVEAFLQDDLPGAYERLVDRLLASPHFGERWGRAWLDLARYTDVVASWLKGTGNAWLYRDWVVAAMNEDRPYDEFVRLQLAADLVEDAPPADRAALGFLGLSPTYWKELRLAPSLIKTVVAEEWDERIDAVSRTFLGLTVACARCHDHKFDPVTMQDYYGLAGVFASSQLADRPLAPDDQTPALLAARERLDNLEAELKKIQDGASEQAQKIQSEIAAIRRDTPAVDQPWAHVMVEASLYVLPDGDDKTRLEERAGEVRDLPVFRRGNPTSPGEVVPRRYLEILSAGRPKPFQQGSGRLELADAMLHDSQALAARVIVNRLWAQHFGRGLVRTTSDFGVQGEPPTHPELLDELAARLIENGWSMKWLHREIVLSATYRQHSIASEKSPSGGPDPQAVDPENRLLWRMNRRRLDIESWRDAMLAAAGNLDPAVGGAPQPVESLDNRRRTIYGTINRYEPSAMLRLYDFPEPSSHSPARDATTTPLQQLFVFNSPFVERQAEAIARRALEGEGASAAERITRCYTWMLSRPPTDQEIAAGEKFLEEIQSEAPTPEGAWRLYAHALLGLNEFLFVD